MHHFAKLLPILFFGTLLAYQCKWGRNPPNSLGVPAKTYILDLDKSYKERWSQIILENKDNIRHIIRFSVSEYVSSVISKVEFKTIHEMLPDFAEELQAVADLLEISFHEVFWYNMMYDSNNYCTSVVFQDKENNIYLGRNLDYGWNDLFTKIQFDIHVKSGGQILFKGNFMGGFIILCTGHKPGKFSISGNQRRSILTSNTNITQDYIVENVVQQLMIGKMSMQSSIKKVLEEANNFNEAVEILSKIEIITPVYYIIAGVKPNEGIVLTMNKDGVYLQENLWL